MNVRSRSLGIVVCLIMATQADLSQSWLLVATVSAALLNWAWVRWRAHRTADLSVPTAR